MSLRDQSVQFIAVLSSLCMFTVTSYYVQYEPNINMEFNCVDRTVIMITEIVGLYCSGHKDQDYSKDYYFGSDPICKLENMIRNRCQGTSTCTVMSSEISELVSNQQPFRIGLECIPEKQLVYACSTVYSRLPADFQVIVSLQTSSERSSCSCVITTDSSQSSTITLTRMWEVGVGNFISVGDFKRNGSSNREYMYKERQLTFRTEKIYIEANRPSSLPANPNHVFLELRTSSSTSINCNNADEVSSVLPEIEPGIKTSYVGVLIGVVVGVVVLCALVILVVFFYLKKRRRIGKIGKPYKHAVNNNVVKNGLDGGTYHELETLSYSKNSDSVEHRTNGLSQRNEVCGNGGRLSHAEAYHVVPVRTLSGAQYHQLPVRAGDIYHQLQDASSKQVGEVTDNNVEENLYSSAEDAVYAEPTVDLIENELYK